MISISASQGHETGALCVERAIVELRRGRAVEVADEQGVSVVVAVERLNPAHAQACREVGRGLSLVLTPERAAAIGLMDPAQNALQIDLPKDTPIETLLALAAGPAHNGYERPEMLRIMHADQRAAAALALARQARLIPALLTHRLTEADADPARLRVDASDITGYPSARGRELQQLSRARVPLATAEDCEFIVYRERFGDADHVAIVIGTPDSAKPVPVRLHSACLTGDLLGSLRCDCGDQLRGAVTRIADAGGGVVLYLAQEGRGIGLVNKLRAYELQDGGLDTLQADQHLGFRADERDYTVAGAMLKDLGFDRVVLLTNNPDKLAALDACEIEVVDRMPLPAPVNTHNEGYLRTKRERAGHLPPACEGIDER